MALQVRSQPEKQLAHEFEPASRPPAWWIAIELVRTVRSLLFLAVLALLALVIVNYTASAGQLGQRLGSAWSQTERSVAQASQAVADAFNPTHPPRYPIVQDTEFAALNAVRVGDAIGDSRDYQFTLAATRRRDETSANPDFGQYALVDRQYTVPRETKLLGLTIRVDRGQQQFVLDRGVSFRIGSKLYKINWVSATDQQAGIAVYRNPDQFTGQLALDSD